MDSKKYWVVITLAFCGLSVILMAAASLREYHYGLNSVSIRIVSMSVLALAVLFACPLFLCSGSRAAIKNIIAGLFGSVLVLVLLWFAPLVLGMISASNYLNETRSAIVTDIDHELLLEESLDFLSFVYSNASDRASSSDEPVWQWREESGIQLTNAIPQSILALRAMSISAYRDRLEMKIFGGDNYTVVVALTNLGDVPETALKKTQLNDRLWLLTRD